eukprot:595213-Rhodomonas_salina.1
MARPRLLVARDSWRRCGDSVTALGSAASAGRLSASAGSTGRARGRVAAYSCTHGSGPGTQMGL